MCAHSMPSTVPSMMYVLAHPIITTSQHDRYCYHCSHFTEKKNEAQGLNQLLKITEQASGGMGIRAWND